MRLVLRVPRDLDHGYTEEHVDREVDWPAVPRKGDFLILAGGAHDGEVVSVVWEEGVPIVEMAAQPAQALIDLVASAEDWRRSP